MSDKTHKNARPDDRQESDRRNLKDAGKKASKENVAEEPQADRYQQNFTSFSEGTPFAQPLVLEDSLSGKTLYDARDTRRGKSTGELALNEREKEQTMDGSAEQTGTVIEYEAKRLDKNTFSTGLDWEEADPRVACNETTGSGSVDEIYDSGTLAAIAESNPKVATFVDAIKDIPRGPVREITKLVATQSAKGQFDGPETIANPKPLTNTASGWLAAAQAIAALPPEKQAEVIGAGLLAGIERYQSEERERCLGATIGVVEALGDFSFELARVAEFASDVVAGNKDRASLRGEEFGEALGRTLVGGVRLFHVADRYLFDMGFSGDYSRPFKDIVSLGGELNRKYAGLPPKEQERVKYKLAANLAAAVAMPAGAMKISKAEKFTEILEDMAALGHDAITGPKDALATIAKIDLHEQAQSAGKAIGQVVDEVLNGKSGGGLRPAFAGAYDGRIARHDIESGIMADYGRDDALEGLDSLAMASDGEGFLDRFVDRFKKQGSRDFDKEGSPDLRTRNPGVSDAELARLAVNDMVAPLSESALKRGSFVKEHYDYMVNELARLNPENLLLLHSKQHRFFFADLEDVAPAQIGRSVEIPALPGIRREHLPGFTDMETRSTFIPSRVFDARQQRWILAKERLETDRDGGLVPTRRDGLLRHEVGQALCEYNGWKNLPRCHDWYHTGRRKLDERFSEYGKKLDELAESLRRSGLSRESIREHVAFKKLQQEQQLFDQYRYWSGDHGIEQTISDLWALKHGGTNVSPEFDEVLLSFFKGLCAVLTREESFRR